MFTRLPHPEPPPLARAKVGQLLRGKWHLDTLIGAGGMATVYAATHRNGKRGAVKILHRELADNENARPRFLQERYAANKVNHPGAVSVLDDDVDDDGCVFLVMELLDGESADGRAQQRPRGRLKTDRKETARARGTQGGQKILGFSGPLALLAPLRSVLRRSPNARVMQQALRAIPREQIAAAPFVRVTRQSPGATPQRALSRAALESASTMAQGASTVSPTSSDRLARRLLAAWTL